MATGPTIKKKEDPLARWRPCAIVVAIGIAAGATVAQVTGMWRWFGTESPRETSEPQDVSPGAFGNQAAGQETAPAHQTNTAGATALRYAHALQSGDIDEAIDLTLWMRERLDFVRLANPEQESVESARRELGRLLQDRKAEGYVLRPEGVEDQYVFCPGSQVELSAVEHVAPDQGADDEPAANALAPTDAEPVDDYLPAVRERVWLRVTYPGQSPGLRTSGGLAIRLLRVAVSVSKEGHVLKAGVIGNLEIDYDSIELSESALKEGGA